MNAKAPLPLAPRLVNRITAAAYVSVGPTLFDEMVADGRMPKPRQVSESRIAWDVRELDAAIDELPAQGEPPRNTWEDFRR